MTPEEYCARLRRDNERLGRIRRRCVVYFTQMVTGGPIKIGASHEPRKRIRQFQPWCPDLLVLLAVMPGGHAKEAELHRQFRSARTRSHGEWFYPVPELLETIQEVQGSVLCVTCGLVAEKGDECHECREERWIEGRRGAWREAYWGNYAVWPKGVKVHREAIPW